MLIDRRHFLGTAALGAAGLLAGCREHSGAARPATGSAPPTGATASGAGTLSPGSSVSPPTTVAPSTTFRGVARYVARVPSSAGTTAVLTFHTEGTAAQVGRLLDMAAALEVPLTLFVVGSWLDANAGLARRLAASDHDLGNHTWSHLALPAQNRATVAAEITRCAEVMQRMLGTSGRWFRPSGSNSTTDLINEEAGRAGYPVVLGFDTDPLDYQDPGAAAVRSRVLTGTHAGSIVSLHAQHQGTIDAFESMVTGLRDKGVTLVRARDVVAI